MSKEEIQRRLIEGIRDSYTLNLAISILEDLDIANKKFDKIKELVNKYGYYTLSEIPDILSIIDGE